MPTYTARAGDDWDSIARRFKVVKSWLLLSNALDPAASPPPDSPVAGAEVHIPGDPPAFDVAPNHQNALDLGPGGVKTLKVRLHDRTPKPMTNVRYRLTCAGVERSGVSADGWVRAAFPAGSCDTIRLEWGARDEDSPHEYERDLHVDCGHDDDDVRARAQLVNLGYNVETRQMLEWSVDAFRRHHPFDGDPLDESGAPTAALAAALRRVFQERECDASRPSGDTAGGSHGER